MKRMLLVLAFPGAVAAADLTVAGLTLGQSFNLPECSLWPGGRPKDYSIVQDRLCFAQRWEIQPNWFRQDIYLPYGKKPQIIRSERVTTYIKDGVLVGLEFTTFGVNLQSVVLKDLTEKYGSPSDTAIQKVQNKMGAAYDGIVAIWALPDIKVTYYGTVTRLDEGLIMVDLPEAAELRKSETDASKKANPKL